MGQVRHGSATNTYAVADVPSEQLVGREIRAGLLPALSDIYEAV